MISDGKNRYTHSTQGLEVGWCLVFEVLGVGNLARCPDALVGWVVDEWCGPLALVGIVLLHWRFPFAAARGFRALGVRDGRGDPITIFLVIPILWLLSLWVWDGGWLINEPVLWLSSLLIDNLIWRILVPVLWLRGLRISDTGLVNPGLWLLVLSIVNFLFRVDGRSEVLVEAAIALLLTINADGVGLVGEDSELVESGGLGNAGHWWVVEVLLLIFTSLGVLVSENEMNLVGSTALVGTEHDNVGRSIGELIPMELLILLEELEVGTTALEALYSMN
jgi:hypothetical protein